jgi:hypothetical protein
MMNVVLEKLSVPELNMKFLIFLYPEDVITLFTGAHHTSLFCTTRIQSTPLHIISQRTVIILFSCRCPQWFSSHMFFKLHFSLLSYGSCSCYMPYSSKTPWHDWRSYVYTRKLWISSIYNSIYLPVTLSLVGPFTGFFLALLSRSPTACVRPLECKTVYAWAVFQFPSNYRRDLAK